MAGIFGIHDAGIGAEQLTSLLARMQQVMTHESWHQAQTAVLAPIAAGRVTLGILNPEPQPACNEGETIWVWLEGELSDFQRRDLNRQLVSTGHQLKSTSDAELLAHLYEERGEDCVRDLDGTFSVAIYDRHLDKLLLAVDRYATRPVYFYARDNRLLFASEVKAIVQDRRILRQLDEQGLIEFFSFRHPLGDRTLFQDVHFLPAGHLITFAENRAKLRCYWEPIVHEDRPPRSQQDYLDEAAAALQRAMEGQLCDGRSIGLFLSGGLDSRQLAGSMPHLDGRFHTFSRGPQESWDVKFGAMVAERVGSQHHVLELKADFLPPIARRGVWVTDGLMTVVDVYVLSVIGLMRPYVDVVLFGMGPVTRALSGISLSKKMLQAQTLDEAAHAFFAQEGTYLPQSMQAQVLSQHVYERTRGMAFETLRQMLKTYQADTPAGCVEAFCLQCRQPRSSGYGPVLARTQLETRSPYGDNDLLERVSRIPAHWRLKRQMQLALLKHTRPDLARVPWEYTGLPADQSTPARIFLQRGRYYVRGKASQWTRGLIPPGTERERANYPVWFRTILRPWLEGLLLDRRTLDRGYFNATYLRQMIADHMSGRRNYVTQFGLLLTFELWNRLFVDGEPVEA
ncbi:MAG TPA: asparagine synthase-related protein [Anaerolineae bacterium]|nr:asparagine synthase-related protein [Anaerolineae bacterium]